VGTIAFACSITKPDVYERCAEPGIRLAAAPESPILARPAIGSIAKSYNALLAEAAAIEELDALILLHQDTEIVQADFCGRIRDALSDRDVGVAGCVGAIGVRSIAWWEGSVTQASFVNSYEEHGGGDLESFSWDWDEAPAYARVGEVETLDGFLVALSPWAVRNVRFDESLGFFHGYDLDYCLQVRAGGRKVVTADVRAIHHRPLEMLPDPEEWIEAHVLAAEKWEGKHPGLGAPPGDWEQRVRRAEAERDAAYAQAHMSTLEGEARARRLERAVAEVKASISWRITAPLRLARR
jgi:Glycosyltransferase like family